MNENTRKDKMIYRTFVICTRPLIPPLNNTRTSNCFGFTLNLANSTRPLGRFMVSETIMFLKTDKKHDKAIKIVIVHSKTNVYIKID